MGGGLGSCMCGVSSCTPPCGETRCMPSDMSIKKRRRSPLRVDTPSWPLYILHPLAVPEEAWDIPSTACHCHNLNGGLLRAVDDEIRLDSPEPEGPVGQILTP